MSTPINSREDRKLLVALMDPQLTSTTTTNNDKDITIKTTNSLNITSCYLPDPSTCEKRAYILVEKRNVKSIQQRPSLCELIAVPPAPSPFTAEDDFGAFLVANQYVVSNGNLYTITPVDPLFWLLRDEELPSTATESTNVMVTPETKPKKQWQPLDQILNLKDKVAQCIDPAQMKNLFATMDLGSDDECFYKFSDEKAVRWLTLKQKRVEQILIQQETRKVQEAKMCKTKSAAESSGGGAFSSSFILPQQISKTPKPTDLSSNSDEEREKRLERRCYEESIQIVCQYLTERWRERFLQHLQVHSEDVLQSEGEKKRKRQQIADKKAGDAIKTPVVSVRPDFSSHSSAANVVSNNKKQKIPAPMTAGAKSLRKVNTKGMKKMSSFFTIKKK